MILSLNLSEITIFSRTILIICFLGFLRGAQAHEKMISSANTETFLREAEACRVFSSTFYRIVGEQLKDSNIVSSPLSVHILLSYLTHGAKGRTAEELITGLSITDIERWHIGYKSLISSLNGPAKADLLIANSVFLQNNVDLLPNFSSIGTDFYDFTVAKLDFTNGVDSAGQINSWAMKQTNDKIKNIISADDITDDTQMILANAIYFKGSWQFPFDVEKTTPKNFYLTKDVVKRVATMSQKKRFRHGDLPELKARYIEIPYTDNNLSMVIVLPTEIDGLSYLEKNFNWNLVLTADHTQKETILNLPKFIVESTINLKEILQKIGFLAMFEDIADLSGIATVPLKVSKVLQKAFIEVNEFGTEAAAVTVAQIRLRRMVHEPDEFNVDRPFMMAIRHKPSDIPLFIGSVRDIGEAIPKDEL
ncbi:leukocyte elastase inhibitor [Diachasma alloeum]|uniref:leukocyte elastase inhibitor n=1 Tax=Diachasma alloeum TaxID=454923 RepID=UPI0007384301|nr:leukocyte elastase inhibitor [Diachasma alloeum]